MNEQWKDVVGYEGYYQVSNYGRIRSVDRIDSNGLHRKGRILNPQPNKRGYVRVHISKGNKTESLFLHRLVAAAFVKNDNPSLDIINHLDNNPSNNRADNLEWTDYKGNMQWAASQGRMKYHPGNLKKAHASKRVSVIAIAPDGRRMKFSSQAEAEAVLGVSHKHIAQCCRKEYGYKSLKGYTFEYADQERQKNAVPKKKKMSADELKKFQRDRMLNNKINVGRKLSEETKKKISDTHYRPVTQYDKTGAKIKTYHNCSIAQQESGIFHISDVATGKRKTAGGYYWEYEK